MFSYLKREFEILSASHAPSFITDVQLLKERIPDLWVNSGKISGKTKQLNRLL